MKIKYIMCLLFFFICLSANAQTSIGIKSSLYMSFNKSSEIQLDDELDFLTYELTFVEEDVSPSFGVFGIMENELLFLRMDIAYREIKSRFRYINYLNFQDLEPVKLEKRERSIIVPFQMGLKFDRFKFGAGPVLSYSFSEDTVLAQIESLEERNKKLTSGFVVGFSIKANNLIFDIQYEQRFHGAAEDIYYRGDKKSFDQASRYVGLGLAYVFELN